MIVAVTVVRVVQVPIVKVVHVVLVLDRLVPAVGAVLVIVTFMLAALHASSSWVCCGSVACSMALDTNAETCLSLSP